MKDTSTVLPPTYKNVLSYAACFENGVLVEASSAFTAFFGYPIEELRGKRLEQLFVLPGPFVLEPYQLELQDVVALRNDQASPHPLRLSSYAVRFDEQIVQLVNFYNSDEDSVLRKVMSTVAVKAPAGASERRRQEFLSTLSHEIRTPLTSVIGYAQLLEDDAGLSETHRELLRHIQASGMQLVSLVEGLIDLSRLEIGGLPLYREEVSFEAILERVLRQVSAEAADKGLEIIVKGEPRVHLLADTLRIEQVLRVYLSNAVKFTHLGGHVQLQISADAHELRCEVVDDGIGISVEDLNHLFQPFFRVTDLEGQFEGGTGLGLALAKRLVELHHGRVWANSEFGRGSRFGFSLPLTEAQEQATEA